MTGLDANGNDLATDAKIGEPSSNGAHPPTSDSLQQIVEERRKLEQFAEEQYARLTALRDQIRADADARVMKVEEVEGIRLERDSEKARAARLEAQNERLQLEAQIAADECIQLKSEVEQQRNRCADFERLLEALKEEAAQREQELREQLEKSERERQEVMEIVNEIERLEAEAQAGGGGPSAVIEPGNIGFPCKHCSKPLQAKERLAGLMMKCTHCTRMTPIPKK